IQAPEPRAGAAYSNEYFLRKLLECLQGALLPTVRPESPKNGSEPADLRISEPRFATDHPALPGAIPWPATHKRIKGRTLRAGRDSAEEPQIPVDPYGLCQRQPSMTIGSATGAVPHPK